VPMAGLSFVSPP
jgi:hypothetical protein